MIIDVTEACDAIYLFQCSICEFISINKAEKLSVFIVILIIW